MLSAGSLARGARWVRRATLAVAAVAIVASVAPLGRGPARLVNLNGRYPVGVPNPAEPSGEGPPGRTALSGYRLSYVTDFAGSALPRGWYLFTGVPGGDPGGRFRASNTVVSGGVLELLATPNPANRLHWFTGGVCQCGVAHVYGAYFVRSRLSGPGPNVAELLWPASNHWPPEIDFNETGGSDVWTSSSLHYGTANTIVRSGVRINMTAWHTWGVIWSPSSVVYTVDGRVWGRFTRRPDIPRVPMTLDFEQRTLCPLHRQCPTAPQQLYVDWVAEYVRG